jgi:hypothetical protein
LAFRPVAPFINGVDGRTRSLAEEVDADGPRRCGARARGRIGGRDDGGGELDEEEKEGGGQGLHRG